MKLDKPLVVLDLEVTSLDPEEGRIVEIGAAKLRGIEASKPIVITGLFTSRINPEVSIPKEATAVHGICNEDVLSSPTFKQISKGLWDFLDGCDLAGYNLAQFDVPYLTAEFKRVGSKWPHPYTKIIDAFRILKTQESATLGWALKYYTGKDIEGAHSAYVDVLATLDVIQHQVAKYNSTTVDELIKLQRNPSWLDEDGKFSMVGDKILVTFGKHQGRELAKVPSDYLDWMLGQSFFKRDTTDIVYEELTIRRARADLKG